MNKKTLLLSILTSLLIITTGLQAVKIAFFNDTPYKVKVRLGTANFQGKDHHFYKWVTPRNDWDVDEFYGKGITIQEVLWPEPGNVFYHQVGYGVKRSGSHKPFIWLLQNKGLTNRQGIDYIQLQLIGAVNVFPGVGNLGTVSPQIQKTEHRTIGWKPHSKSIVVDKIIEFPITREQRKILEGKV